MKELTEEQFIHDAQLLAATHSKEELEAIRRQWARVESVEESYQGWCAALGHRDFITPGDMDRARAAYNRDQT
jgi:hypothetical protein